MKDTAADQGRRVADTAKEQAGQVKDTAKEQAGQVKDTAVEQGQQVAAVAKDEAAQVKNEAVSSLKDIVGQSRTELASQAGTSQNRLAEYVHSLSDELGTLASKSDSSGPITDLAHRGARTGGELSHWLSEHEPADVLAEVTSFARRRPWAFLGASVLAGGGRGSCDPQPRRRGQGRARRAAGRQLRPRRAGRDRTRLRSPRRPRRARRLRDDWLRDDRLSRGRLRADHADDGLRPGRADHRLRPR